MDNKKVKKTEDSTPEDSISRRKALQKMGYAAFASSTMFLLLNNPTKVYASSQPGGGTDPGGGFDFKSGNKEEETQKSQDAWKNDDDPWK